MTSNDEFGATMARSYEESEEWWPEPVRPHPDAPNVIVFLLDDVGFGQLSRRFGGLIDTPNIDRLADNGLRFNDFHTTAGDTFRSTTRAASPAHMARGPHRRPRASRHQPVRRGLGAAGHGCVSPARPDLFATIAVGDGALPVIPGSTRSRRSAFVGARRPRDTVSEEGCDE